MSEKLIAAAARLREVDKTATNSRNVSDAERDVLNAAREEEKEEEREEEKEEDKKDE